MFDKLKYMHNFTVPPVTDRLTSYGPIHYDYVADGTCQSAFEVIPEQYRKDFRLMRMKIDTMYQSIVPPHTDSEIMTTINFYISTAATVTEFYRVDTSKLKYTQIFNQTDGVIFDKSCLTTAGSFMAKPGEAWLLDVLQPHSVVSFNKGENRVAIALQSLIHPYAKVKEFLQETGNL